MKHQFLISTVLLTAITTRSFAQAGTLDKDFNSGIVTTSISTDDEFARAIAIQPDGKIVIAGNVSFNGAYADFALVRYNGNGTLDSHFGIGGKLTTPIGESDDIATSVVLQPDGKIVVAGYSYVESHFDFALARYDIDGMPDKSFSSDGKLITSIGDFDNIVNAVAIQPDGKIVVAGYSSNGKKNDLALARYNVDGTLDNSFSSDGMLIVSIGNGNDVANSLALQPDGKIVVAGYSDSDSDNDFAIARFNNDGTPDHLFNIDGIVTTSIGTGNDYARSLTIQPDGKIVVAGESYNGAEYDFALARYGTDGTPDNSFGTDGKLTTHMGTNSGYGRSVILQRDGKIIVAGYSSSNGTNYHFALARYDADGNLDVSFTPDGKLITPVGVIDDVVNSLAIQKDGKIIVAGYSDNGADYDIALVRYFSGLDPEDEATEDLQQIKIFPNPASDQVQFEVTGLEGNPQLNVFNIFGEKVSSINLNENKTISLDITDLPAGAYQVIINSNDQEKAGRFVKQ